MYAMSNLTFSISVIVSRCSSSVSPQNPAMKSDDSDTSTERAEGEERGRHRGRRGGTVGMLL